MKSCKKCNQKKELNQFYKSKTGKDGYAAVCKNCFLETYYKPHPNKMLCKECNTPLTNENGLNSGHKRKDGSIIFSNICKTCIKPFRNKWAKNRRNNIDVRLYESIKTCINTNLKKDISSNIIKYLGCNINEYKHHLEQQFTPEMNWNNYGTYWEIDHIYPLSKGGSFHYTNTRPLSIHENRTKYNKI